MYYNICDLNLYIIGKVFHFISTTIFVIDLCLFIKNVNK